MQYISLRMEAILVVMKLFEASCVGINVGEMQAILRKMFVHNSV